MERGLSYEAMIETLNMDVQREKFFVIKWIEEKLAKEKEARIFTTEVAVRLVEEFSYNIENGIVTGVVFYEDMLDYFEDPSSPKVEELKLLEASYPKRFKWLRELCLEMQDAFDHPHSCTIDYFQEEKVCCGCNRSGVVNYTDNCGNTAYYCGHSERCIP